MKAATDTERNHPASASSAVPEPTGSPTAESGTPGGSEHPIVFFDGVCGLCNSVVDFAMRKDRNANLRFAPLQGETASRLLSAEDVRNLNTFVLCDARGVHRRSTAASWLLWHLGGVWAVASVLLWIVPQPVRDFGYAIVAKNRYAWFGKKETCRMPTAAERERILP